MQSIGLNGNPRTPTFPPTRRLKTVQSEQIWMSRHSQCAFISRCISEVHVLGTSRSEEWASIKRGVGSNADTKQWQAVLTPLQAVQLPTSHGMVTSTTKKIHMIWCWSSTFCSSPSSCGAKENQWPTKGPHQTVLRPSKALHSTCAACAMHLTWSFPSGLAVQVAKTPARAPSMALG
eukprot:6024925-Amphidinium_carterae.1